MTKLEFLKALENRLSGLPKEDIEKSVDYYREIIDDRIEDGVSEEEAVAAVGTLDEIASNILTETPLPKLIREKVAPKRALRVWEIVLIILGSPIWLSLLVAAAAVVFSVYIVLWSAVIVLYAVVISFGAGAVAGLFGLVYLCASGNIVCGTLFAGMGLMCAGLAILMFFGSNLAAKGIAVLGKKIWLGIKFCFVGKEEA